MTWIFSGTSFPTHSVLGLFLLFTVQFRSFVGILYEEHDLVELGRNNDGDKRNEAMIYCRAETWVS